MALAKIHLRRAIPLLALSFLMLSCGKEEKRAPSPAPPPPRKERKTEPADSARKDDAGNVVDSKTFSEAFSKASYNLDDAASKKKTPSVSPDKFFDEGKLAIDKFKNDAYKNTAPPKRSLAAKLDKGKRFSWLPKWDYAGGGGVKVPAAELSNDESVVGILENVKSENGAKATLLVLVGTYSWKILQIHLFPGKTFSKLLFLGRGKRAALWEGNDIQGGKLHIVNLLSGQIESSSGNISADPDSIISSPDGGKIYMNLNSPKQHILVFDTENITSNPAFLECSGKRGALALSPDGKFIALAGPELIEVIKLSDGKKLREFKSPLGALPDAFTFLDDSSNMAILAYMKPCYMIVDDKSEKLLQQSGRHLEYLPKTKRLLLEGYKNKRISVIDVATLKEVCHFDPEKVKPRTTGSPILTAYLSKQDKYVEFDTMGNLCLLRLPSKKWRKEIIFSAQK